MSFFNSNITGAGGSGGSAGGLVTKFEKTVAIGSEETAEIQISLKDDISNYANIANEQIIVDIANVGASEAGTANLTQSYDAEQGVLTITSDNSKIPFVVSSTVEVTIYVAGAVQIPPPPEYSYELESPFVWTSNFKYKGYEQGGGFLEIPIMISGNYMVSAINAGGSNAVVTYNGTDMVIGVPVYINAGEMITCNWSKGNTGNSQIGSFTFMATFD